MDRPDQLHDPSGDQFGYLHQPDGGGCGHFAYYRLD